MNSFKQEVFEVDLTDDENMPVRKRSGQFFRSKINEENRFAGNE